MALPGPAPSDHVMIARVTVGEQNSVGAVWIWRSIGLVGDAQLRQNLAARQPEIVHCEHLIVQRTPGVIV